MWPGPAARSKDRDKRDSLDRACCSRRIHRRSPARGGPKHRRSLQLCSLTACGRVKPLVWMVSRPHALVMPCPPPQLEERRSDIMFSVLADGPRGHRLSNGAGADVGWIRGRGIGFHGLRSESDTIAAAAAGWRSLQTLLHRACSRWPRQRVDWDRLRFMHDGAHEWVSDGRIPLARVLRAPRRIVAVDAGDAPGPGPAHELAIEFVVPSWLDEAAMIPVAHALRNVLASFLRQDAAMAVDTRPEHRHLISLEKPSCPPRSLIALRRA
jgi:hypothetical protein